MKYICSLITVEDINNIIEVGESLEYLSFRLSKEGKTVEEISQIINMPKEFVKENIRRGLNTPSI